ncbi:hypothetical protein [Streptomyces sp. NBC_00996]|uniref:GntT/GntP/DsdX family permease n=1 Tax=Streptomyces sp. NBC_00996 TaxID=2903710 RepID=UPI0038669245|nr:hypothetical protein OG390_18385 [Streptomyces sp. NBC_00996]
MNPPDRWTALEPVVRAASRSSHTSLSERLIEARRLIENGATELAATVYAEVYGVEEPPTDGGAPAASAPDGHGTAVLTKPAPALVAEEVAPPSFAMVLTLIVSPILLILAGTLGQIFLAEGSTLRAALTVLGAPMVALLLDVALCAYFLGGRRGWDRTRIANVMTSALPPVAMVILVAGAGGVFGKVPVASGIGDAIADVLDRTGLPALFLAFLMALALRAAQGSTTVALITTAGILTPLLQRADLSTGQLSLVAPAMGAGGLSVSHINDAGYWMFTKPAGLDVATGPRTWTVLTTTMGVTRFGLTAALWPLV